MAWADLNDAGHSVALLQRSLKSGRLGHAYLFAGESIGILERSAAELAATVNCQASPAVSVSGIPVAACGKCSSCRRIRQRIHPDVHWLRAESKLRLIKIDQVRELIGDMQLKAAEARYKVGILVSADRMNSQGANAFLKTLEEPPPRSLLILLTTEPDRLLETIVSRCLRLSFPGEARVDDREMAWLRTFTPRFCNRPASLLARYGILDGLLRQLATIRTEAEAEVEDRFPAPAKGESDPEWLKQVEEETKAAVEAAYRHRRGKTLRALQWWLRDVWLTTLRQPRELLALPEFESETTAVASRLAPERAQENLQLLEETQAMLHTNVQEALALEVAILRLDL